MLFWTRAFLCIGTITVLAIQRLPHDTSRDSLPRVAAPAATALIGEACHARPDLCAAAVTRGLGTLVPNADAAVLHEGADARTKPLHHSLAPSLPVALGRRSLT